MRMQRDRGIWGFAQVLLSGLRCLGVDRAIAYTVIGRLWTVVSGPITLTLIAHFLSAEEQGFFYTFFGILALQVFLELGLSSIIVQFSSHEKIHLEWTSERSLEGDHTAKGRLASLFRSTLCWYALAAAAAVIILLPLGFLFFSRNTPEGTHVAWEVPWVWMVLVSGAALLTTPLYAIIEGCGLVKEVAWQRLIQAVTCSVVLWIAFTLRWGLFAAPVMVSIGWLMGVFWLIYSRGALFLDLARTQHTNLSWREIWPLQWRIALSWISNYFMFQLFGPALFAFAGPIAAGQMGMSMTIIGAISTSAIAWMLTKASPFGSLVARREFQELDRMFFHAMWSSFWVALIGGATAWIAVLVLHYVQHPLRDRILDPITFGLLAMASIVQHIVGSYGIYLRAHKQEPFVGISLLSAALICLCVYFLGGRFGARGMMAGYFGVVLIIGLGMGSRIFLTKRREWHAQEPVTN